MRAEIKGDEKLLIDLEGPKLEQMRQKMEALFSPANQIESIMYDQ